MNRLLILLAALTLVLTTIASTQEQGPPDDGRGRRGGERLQHYKHLRLIEELKLTEEESVRFFARQRAHEEKVRDLMKTRNDLIAGLDSLLEVRHDPADLLRMCQQVMDLDRKIGQQRDQFFDEQRKALSPEQFARFLVFERDFGRQVRDAMGDNFRKRHRPAPDGMEE